MPRAAWYEVHARSFSLVLLLSVVLACGTLVGFDIWRTRDEGVAIIARDMAETANLARSMAQHAHDIVQSVDTAVIDVREAAERDGLSARTTPHLRQLLRVQAATLPALHRVLVFDAGGANVADSLPTPREAPNAGDRPYFQYHRDHPNRDVLVSGPMRSMMDGAWVVTVSRRLDAEGGSFAGVVTGTIAVDTLRQLYAGFDLDKHGTITLAAADGTVVANAPDDPHAAGSSTAKGEFFTRVLPLWAAGSSKFVSALDGTLRIGSHQQVEGYPLVVLVSHDRDEVLAAWRSNARYHLAVTSVVAAMLGLVGSCLVLQARRRLATEARLAEQERHYRMLAENGSDLVTHLGPNLRRMYVSPASMALLGYEPHELMRLHPRQTTHDEDWPACEAELTAATIGGTSLPISYRMRRKDGTLIWVETIARRMEGSEGCLIAVREITQRKKVEQDLHEANLKLQHLVMLDGLTGIGNRRSFDTTLEREFHGALRTGLTLSLLMIDIDHFKRFNDSYGHLVGDECLRVVAATLHEQTKRAADHPVRYGGEEFAMLLPQTEGVGAAMVADRICEAVRRLDLAHLVPGRAGSRIEISVSIGVATIDPARDGTTAQKLIESADKALYAAKQGGRDRAVCADWMPADMLTA